MVKMDLQLFGGRGGSSGNTSTEQYNIHGSTVNRIVADNIQSANRQIDGSSFTTIQNTDWSFNPDRDSPGKMVHYDEEVMAVRVGNKTNSVEVGHRILGDGTELYSVEASSSVMNSIGEEYTRGRSQTRSGYLYNSRNEARSVARRALKASIS